MRDPERIKEIIPLLQSAWEMAPDLRLGQLLCILSVKANTNMDPFYMEDDELLIGIQRFNEQRCAYGKEIRS